MYVYSYSKYTLFVEFSLFGPSKHLILKLKSGAVLQLSPKRYMKIKIKIQIEIEIEIEVKLKSKIINKIINKKNEKL